jgi:hypothetical protein
MSRGAGRKQASPRQPVPGTPEADDIGESARQDPAGSPIPGLTGNIANYPTVRQMPAAPQPDESFDQYRGMMAHGVPNDSDNTTQRALMERGSLAQHRPPTPAQHGTERAQPVPIPVRVVEGYDGEVYLSASPRTITVPPNNGADPARLCGRNPKRNRILLLNEDTATNVRFAWRVSDLVNGGGALLPWPATSYLVLETQDELYACTVSGTLSVTVSVIEEFEQAL